MSVADEIRDAVEDRLTFDPDVEASHIAVENLDGEIVLSGTVPSYPQSLAAAAAAQSVAGVRSVRNHLDVVLPSGDRRDDLTLTTAANNALTLNETVPVGVEAVARNGVITLTGTVRGGLERTAAELVAAELPGVRSVTNDIRISAGAEI